LHVFKIIIQFIQASKIEFSKRVGSEKYHCTLEKLSADNVRRRLYRNLLRYVYQKHLYNNIFAVSK